METLTNCAGLTESRSRILVPAYWLCCKSTGAFQEAACVLWIRIVNQVSESRFVNLLVGFSKLDMSVNICSSSSAAYWKGFHIHNRLTETQFKLSLSGLSKVLHD